MITGACSHKYQPHMITGVCSHKYQPCLKNSSQTLSLHRLLMLHSRQGLDISAHFNAIYKYIHLQFSNLSMIPI